MTQSTEKISVIIPVHNRTTYLGDTLQSVADQTHTTVEVILVNDGSGPEVGPVLLALCEKYPFAQMLELDKQFGVSHARNRGIEQATGSYFHFLDDDDRIAPDFYERSLAVLKKSADVSIAVAELLSDDTTTSTFQKQKKIYAHFYRSSGTKPIDHWSYFLMYSPPIHAMLFKKEVFKESKFNENLVYGEDRYLWLQLREKGVKFQKLDYTGAFYRVGESVAKGKCYKQQAVFFEKLLSSGMVQERKGQNYVYTFLFLLAVKTRSVLKAVRYASRALQAPVQFLKHVQFLRRYR